MVREVRQASRRPTKRWESGDLQQPTVGRILKPLGLRHAIRLGCIVNCRKSDDDTGWRVQPRAAPNEKGFSLPSASDRIAKRVRILDKLANFRIKGLQQRSLSFLSRPARLLRFISHLDPHPLSAILLHRRPQFSNARVLRPTSQNWVSLQRRIDEP